MRKLVIIINGVGGAGKDTLCDFAAKHFKVMNVSSITPIKELAANYGWNGEKDAKSRKFLADLKKVFVEYNDLPSRYLNEEYNSFFNNDDEILFVHIREKEEIEKFKKRVVTPCITLLIRRDTDGIDSWGNESDDNVEQYEYDYYFKNNGTLEEAEMKFVEFLRTIMGEYSGISI